MKKNSKKGLIVKSPWIDMIFQGLKIWEIRNKKTNIRGKIYLIKSGTGKILGEVELIDCIEFLKEDLFKYKDKHCIPETNKSFYDNEILYAWVLSNPLLYKEPIPYKHKKGAIIWVNLD